LTTHDTGVKALVQRYFAAVNDERWDDVVALFGEDAFLYVSSVAPKHGKEQIRRFYEDIATRFVSHETTIIFLIAEGSRAAVTIRFEGIAADGQTVVTHATDTFTCEGMKIQELRIVFDTADFQGRARQ
jgi:ketosteroid isomerase-like protein